MATRHCYKFIVWIAGVEGKCYGETMAAKKRAKKKTFSVVKAVKANARDRVGQPRPERVIEAVPREQKHKSKHKNTLTELLGSEE